jgi:hypothetical protein
MKNNSDDTKKARRQPRRVDYLHIKEDFVCAHLGALGFATSYIQERTGHRLSVGQITYRLQKAHLSRMQFRRGESVYAQLVLRNMRQVTEEKLMRHLYTITPPTIRESAGLQRTAAA